MAFSRRDSTDFLADVEARPEKHYVAVIFLTKPHRAIAFRAFYWLRSKDGISVIGSGETEVPDPLVHFINICNYTAV